MKILNRTIPAKEIMRGANRSLETIEKMKSSRVSNYVIAGLDSYTKTSRPATPWPIK